MNSADVALMVSIRSVRKSDGQELQFRELGEIETAIVELLRLQIVAIQSAAVSSGNWDSLMAKEVDDALQKLIDQFGDKGADVRLLTTVALDQGRACLIALLEMVRKQSSEELVSPSTMVH